MAMPPTRGATATARVRSRRGDAVATAAVPAAAAAFGPALGCLLDSLPTLVSAILGGVIARLAEKLWSKRHTSEVAITSADTAANRALLAACPHFAGGRGVSLAYTRPRAYASSQLF